MKIILLSIGTRGDIDPFISIGELLKARGHHVICAFPEQFRNLVENANMEFASLGKRFLELLDSDVGKFALGGRGSGLKKMAAYVRLAGNQTEINKELLKKQYDLIENENPDRIVHNGKAIYPILWGSKKRVTTVLVSPVPYLHYMRDHAHIAFSGNYGLFLNKLSYSFANFGLILTILIAKKWLKMSEKIPPKDIRNALLSNKVIYTISPSLFPRPVYWNKNVQILGYHQPKRLKTFRADRRLMDFLKKHNQLLFVTFGSMTNPEPKEKTRILIDILERNKIPALINTASGGLSKPDTFDPQLLHFVSGIPYDWIFPKIYSVIHHGGSGTTHLGLKYGCATLIVPHIIDQFAWNRIIYRMGAGPMGIRINKISTKRLEPKIVELVKNPSFKNKAEKIAHQMNKEDFGEEIYKTIIENKNHT